MKLIDMNPEEMRGKKVYSTKTKRFGGIIDVGDLAITVMWFFNGTAEAEALFYVKSKAPKEFTTISDDLITVTEEEFENKELAN